MYQKGVTMLITGELDFQEIKNRLLDIERVGLELITEFEKFDEVPGVLYNSFYAIVSMHESASAARLFINAYIAMDKQDGKLSTNLPSDSFNVQAFAMLAFTDKSCERFYKKLLRKHKKAIRKLGKKPGIIDKFKNW